VELNSYLEGSSFEINAHITDPGSDDISLIYSYSTQIVNVTYLNAPPNPDPYPSPEVNPVDITDSAPITYDGPGTLTLTAVDDDGGTVVATLSIS
jgi:hypothetical protein